MVIIFWERLMFDKIFLSPQVKRSVIISNKHDIYELPHEGIPEKRDLGPHEDPEPQEDSGPQEDPEFPDDPERTQEPIN